MFSKYYIQKKNKLKRFNAYIPLCIKSKIKQKKITQMNTNLNLFNFAQVTGTAESVSYFNFTFFKYEIKHNKSSSILTVRLLEKHPSKMQTCIVEKTA